MNLGRLVSDDKSTSMSSSFIPVKSKRRKKYENSDISHKKISDFFNINQSKSKNSFEILIDDDDNDDDDNDGEF